MYLHVLNKYQCYRCTNNILLSTQSYHNQRKSQVNRKSTQGSANRSKLKLAPALVHLAPKSWQPYLKLSRCDRPAGTWLLYWPSCWGIASAAEPGCLPDIYMLLLFGAGALAMRGAGCTVNDIMDRDIDSKVIRTMDRPLVNGDVSLSQAWFYVVAQLSLALTILLQLNWYSIFLGSSSLALMFVYPMMKRITNWPQVVLGLTVNWGTLLGYSAVQGHLDATICIPIYTAAVTWTIIYDTIYAHQDRHDDIKVGVKSTAIYFGDKTKTWLAGLSVFMVSNLVMSGIMNEQCWPYYTSIALVSVHLASQVCTLNVDDPDDCTRKFMSNVKVGFIILGGILFGTLVKKE